MHTKNQHAMSDIDHYISEILDYEHPKTVKQLINSIHRKYDLPEQQIMQRVLLLQDRGEIVLRDQLPLSFTLKDFMFSIHSYWYLIIVVLAATTTTMIITNLENAPLIGNILVYVRYLFGSIFVLFIPGYSFIKALFPLKGIDNLESAALSIGMSLSIVALNALILNFTPWGISTIPITLSLLCLTLTLSTIGVAREYQTLRDK